MNTIILYKQGTIINGVEARSEYKWMRNGSISKCPDTSILASHIDGYVQPRNPRRILICNQIPMLSPVGNIALQGLDGRVEEISIENDRESFARIPRKRLSNTSRMTVLNGSRGFYVARLSPEELQQTFTSLKYVDAIELFRTQLLQTQ